jgi:hypothetical protein
MKKKIKLEGRFKAMVLRKGGTVERFFIQNDVTNIGIDEILDAMFTTASTPTWYAGLINSTPTPTLSNADTMASHAGWSETASYDETTRPVYNPAVALNQVITNSSSVCVFTISATVTVWGCFITTFSVKSGTSGVLWSTGQFRDGAGAPTSIDLVDGDVLKVVYEVEGKRA